MPRRFARLNKSSSRQARQLWNKSSSVFPNDDNGVEAPEAFSIICDISVSQRERPVSDVGVKHQQRLGIGQDGDVTSDAGEGTVELLDVPTVLKYRNVTSDADGVEADDRGHGRVLDDGDAPLQRIDA